MRFLNWISARLARPGAHRGVVILALVLALPSLASPFFIDEHVQAARWRAAFDPAAPRGLGSFINSCFVFGSGDLAANQREMEHGLGAWWASPDFKIAFWRPLAALTHALDLTLWPRSTALMHVHSLAWFAALLVAVGALYRRMLPPRVATLALALYAWDDARGQVLSWIAKRNALLAGLFGVAAILAYDRWRRDRWAPGAVLAPAALALGLLSSEIALSATAFLAAYALHLDAGPLARRALRLVPSAAVVLAWQLYYVGAGYGTAATTGYLHPLHEPRAWALRLVEGAPAVVLGQLTPLWSDLLGVYPTALKVLVGALAALLLVALARRAGPSLRASPAMRFWVTGAALGVPLIAAAGVADQNLTFVGLGAAPALALVLDDARERLPAGRGARALVGALAVFNLAVAPALLPLRCLTMLGMGFTLPQTDASIPRDPSVAARTLVVLWAPSEGGVYASQNRRFADGTPRPGRTRILATGFGDLAVTRVDATTLRVRVRGGFFDHAMHRLMRGPSQPFRVGDVVSLSDLSATVTAVTPDGRPGTVVFRFATSLESPTWLWTRSVGARLVPWTPPAVGATVTVPAALRGP